MTPKVDTFEHNIIEEIKRKDASLTQISAASNDVGNIPVVETQKRPLVIIIAGVVLILCLIGGGALAYFYFTDSLLPPSAAPVKVSPADVPKKIALLASISPTLDTEIGRSVTKVEKKNEGYIIMINDYSAVFSYMTRNEGDYIGELAASFSPSISPSVASSTLGTTAAPASTSTLKVLPPTTTASSTPVVTSPATSTKIATSTQQKVTKATTSTTTNATTTKTTSTPKKLPTSKKVTKATTTPVQTTSTTTPSVPSLISIPLEEAPVSLFSDVTISNQNMRVWKNGTKIVVYAFVSTNTVLISNSTEGILSLKNAILH